jgi:hypothetical protein
MNRGVIILGLWIVFGIIGVLSTMSFAMRVMIDAQ